MKKTIYYLYDYNWERGILVSEGPKNYKIEIRWKNGTKIKSFPKEKCAFPVEKIVVIWETWKGKNGRGGYRVERKLYSDDRILAENVSQQAWNTNPGSGRINEIAYGVKK